MKKEFKFLCELADDFLLQLFPRLKKRRLRLLDALFDLRNATDNLEAAVKRNLPKSENNKNTETKG